MKGDLFGHPRGLFFLFSTEMWERLSFYGMRALLIGYLAKYLLLSGHVDQVLFYPQVKNFLQMLSGPLSVQQLSSLIYSWYVALVYASPLLGGWIADRFTGQRKLVIVGIIMMAMGHFLMAAERMLFPALLFLIFGTGFFKTNTSAQVGGLYRNDDARRDTAYSIFYVGINVGGALGPLICGTLGEKVGWHYGFASAGVGILFALAIYLRGWNSFPPEPERKKRRMPRTRLTAREWKSVIAILLLIIPLTLYWACNEQWGDTVTYWSIDNTDRSIKLFGWHTEIPWTWFQSLNPVVIIAGTPLIAALWQRQGARVPNPLSKMIWGCLLMTAANLVMAVAAWHVGPGKAHWLWLVAYFTILTVGEIYLYPVSLSLCSRVAPASVKALMMGVIFVPNFLGGGFLQGWLATFWGRMDKALFFVMIAAVAALAAAMIALMRNTLQPHLEETS